jgi:hypothetical protein
MNEDLPYYSFDIYQPQQETDQEVTSGPAPSEHVIQALLNYSAALFIKTTPQGLTVKTMLN